MSITDKSAFALNAQQVCKSTFDAMINEEYIGDDAERYQNVFDHVIWKVGFSIGKVIYILPSNLNLSIGKSTAYNNKILISNMAMKTDSNRNIN